MNFSKEELVDMVYCLGECERNCLLASRVYRQRYPERRKIQVYSFEKLKERFENSGNVAYPLKKMFNRPVMNEENEFLVLASIQENPHLSTRQLSRETAISKSSVNRIIRKHRYHPYHISLHQELHGNDFVNRIRFCEILLEKIQENNRFLNNVLWSDEATFKSNGLVNKHNMHYYSTENPHWMRQIDNQIVWSLNVWGGVLDGHIIGPYFFDGPLNGQMYLHFLRYELPLLLEDINLDTRHAMWLQHDGAPPHVYRPVRIFLNMWREESWIGRGAPLGWPARSPDLTPCDFFLWGYVKQEVYVEAPTTRENMKERIRQCFRNITARTLLRVNNTLIRRLELCIEEEGRVFEHLM